MPPAMSGSGGQALAACRVVCEELPQMQLPDLLIVGCQGLPCRTGSECVLRAVMVVLLGLTRAHQGYGRGDSLIETLRCKTVSHAGNEQSPASRASLVFSRTALMEAITSMSSCQDLEASG